MSLVFDLWSSRNGGVDVTPYELNQRRYELYDLVLDSMNNENLSKTPENMLLYLVSMRNRMIVTAQGKHKFFMIVRSEINRLSSC